jgi:cytochrome b561
MTSTWRNSASDWGIAQQILHWLTAALVLTQIGLGIPFATSGEEAPDREGLLSAHIAVGATVFVLTLLRFLWRQANPCRCCRTT